MKHTLAIAGCCGYIGTHMTRAALDLGLKVCGIDPLLKVSDWEQHSGFEAVETVDAFCDLGADRYYLALQPDHRAPYLDRLIRDGRPIFSEKPMSRARDPEQCLKLVADLADSDATIGYNFLLIFNPITEKILTFFRRHQSVGLRYMRSLSEKNRESRRNDRNLKFMEPIQYQESIHSLALLLALLCEAKALDRPVLETIFPEGLVVVGESQLYDAPSSDYDAVPDGQFYGTLTGGRFRADVMTNFKRFDHLGLPTVPRKVIELRGEADGEAFEIVADYQRGRESLTINREPIDLPVFEPYQFIWQQVLSDEQTGPRIRTDEHLAALTYRLSAALWSASYTGNELMLDSDAALIAQSFTYRDAFNQGRLPQYRRRSGLEWVERHMIDPVVDVAEGIRGRLERR